MTRTCYECCCADSIDNPILGIEDEHGVVEEWICMECFTERLDADTNTNY